MRTQSVVVIAHNIRSTHNVGSILRTCEGFGVSMVYFCGYTPYPSLINDPRLPHQRLSQTAKIAKTALGAEISMPMAHSLHIEELITTLKKDAYDIIGLEQHHSSTMIHEFEFPNKVALILGEERYGINSDILKYCDNLIEISMKGLKESFNVSVATGIALYAISAEQRNQDHIDH